MAKFIGPLTREQSKKQKSEEKFVTQYPKNKVSSVKDHKEILLFKLENYLNPIILEEFMNIFGNPFAEGFSVINDKNVSLVNVIKFIICNQAGIVEINYNLNELLTKITFLSVTNILAYINIISYYERLTPITAMYIRNLKDILNKPIIDISSLCNLLKSNEIVEESQIPAITDMTNTIDKHRKDLMKFIQNSLNEFQEYIYARKVGLTFPTKYKKIVKEELLNQYLTTVSPIKNNHWEDAHYIKKLLTMSNIELEEILTPQHYYQFETYKKTLIIWISMINTIQSHIHIMVEELKTMNLGHLVPEYKFMSFNINDIIKSRKLITIDPEIFNKKSGLSNNQFGRILLVLDNMTRALVLKILNDYTHEWKIFPSELNNIVANLGPSIQFGGKILTDDN